MPVPPRPLSASLGVAFTCAAARTAGETRARLRAKDVEIVFRGARRRVAPANLGEGFDRPGEPLHRDREIVRRVHALADAYAPLMVAHAFVTGRSAAAMLGAPVVDPGGELDVGVIAPHRAPRRSGIRGHKIDERLVTVIERDGRRISDGASTWAMLGREFSTRDLVRLGDALVRIPRGSGGRPMTHLQITTPDQLRSAVDAGRRMGAPRLRAALELIRVGAMSPLETDWRLGAAEAGLPEPLLDVEIRTPDGRLLGIADAAYPGYRTLVEVEGDHHRTDRAQWERDIEKHAAYIAHGWTPVRLTASHIRGYAATAPRILGDALRRAGWRPTV